MTAPDPEPTDPAGSNPAAEEPAPRDPGTRAPHSGQTRTRAADTVCEVRGVRVETGRSGESNSRLVREIPGGPTLVEGPVELVTPNGDRVYSDRFMVAVCACRRSKNYPLCDTSHRRKVRPD